MEKPGRWPGFYFRRRADESSRNLKCGCLKAWFDRRTKPSPVSSIIPMIGCVSRESRLCSPLGLTGTLRVPARRTGRVIFVRCSGSSPQPGCAMVRPALLSRRTRWGYAFGHLRIVTIEVLSCLSGIASMLDANSGSRTAEIQGSSRRCFGAAARRGASGRGSRGGAARAPRSDPRAQDRCPDAARTGHGCVVDGPEPARGAQ